MKFLKIISAITVCSLFIILYKLYSPFIEGAYLVLDNKMSCSCNQKTYMIFKNGEIINYNIAHSDFSKIGTYKQLQNGTYEADLPYFDKKEKEIIHSGFNEDLILKVDSGNSLELRKTIFPINEYIKNLIKEIAEKTI